MSPILTQQHWAKVNAITGWLRYPAAHLSWLMLRELMRLGIAGDVIELGVYKGKYLALLAAATQGSGRRVVGIDGFFGGGKKPLEEKWAEQARKEMESNVASVSPVGDRLSIVRADSHSLSPSSMKSLIGGPVCFASVDAGHGADDVEHDMRLAAAVLAVGGVVAADDVFNHAVPGVVEGMCRFLGGETGHRVATFASCGNKVFLTTRNEHAGWLKFCKAVAQDGTEPYLVATREHAQRNSTISFAPHFFGSETLPFIA